MSVVQKMKRNEKDVFSVAEKYYSILSAVNNLKLTQKEIELISFTSVKGNISYSNNRKEFCERYNTTSPTVYNIVSKLKRMGIFVKDGTKVKVNPIITLPFDKPISLEINLTHGQTS